MGGTILVVCILVLIVVGAVISSAKHFKGEGGCCGGGGSVKVKGDKIKDVVAVKTIYIDRGNALQQLFRSCTECIEQSEPGERKSRPQEEAGCR